MVPLPEDEGDEEDSAEDGDGGDGGIAEPVLFLTFVEEEFEASDAGGDEAQTEEVDGRFDAGAGLDVGWIFDHAVGEPEGEDADGDVDEEDPVPVEVVGDPAAEGGADGRRDDDGHAVEGEGLAAFFNGEGIGEDGLLGGCEAAAADALEDAAEDKDGESGGDAAEEGAEGEEGDAGHVEALAADAVGDPSGDGEDDGAGDEVAGEDPGGFVLGGAEGAGDVGQGYVGDGGIEHLHEGGEGDGESDGPGVEPGYPDFFCGFRGCHAPSIIKEDQGWDGGGSEMDSVCGRWVRGQTTVGCRLLRRMTARNRLEQR